MLAAHELPDHTGTSTAVEPGKKTVVDPAADVTMDSVTTRTAVAGTGDTAIVVASVERERIHAAALPDAAGLDVEAQRDPETARSSPVPRRTMRDGQQSPRHSPRRTKVPADALALGDVQALLQMLMAEQPNMRVAHVEKVPPRRLAQVRFTRAVQTLPVAPETPVLPGRWTRALILAAIFAFGVFLRVAVIDYSVRAHEYPSWAAYYNGGAVWRIPLWRQAAGVAAELAADEARGAAALVGIEARYWQTQASRYVRVVPGPEPVFPPPLTSAHRLLPGLESFYDFDGSVSDSPARYMLSQTPRVARAVWRRAVAPWLCQLALQLDLADRLTCADLLRERVHVEPAVLPDAPDAGFETPKTAPEEPRPRPTGDAARKSTLRVLVERVAAQIPPLEQASEQARALLVRLQHDVWSLFAAVRSWLQDQDL